MATLGEIVVKVEHISTSDVSEAVAMERYAAEPAFRAVVDWLLAVGATLRDVHHAFYAVGKIGDDKFLEQAIANANELSADVPDVVER